MYILCNYTYYDYAQIIMLNCFLLHAKLDVKNYTKGFIPFIPWLTCNLSIHASYERLLMKIFLKFSGDKK